MLTTSILAPVATLSLLVTSAVAAFSPTAKNNVAVYWGQGPYQKRLVETCKNSNIDIINIAFVNVFPDQGAGGYPGSNFGNACDGTVYTVNGTQTSLLKSCKYIGPDIKTCQSKYGKKILLSLGGGYPINQYLVNDTSAVNFATFLWGAFGPQTTAWTKANKPRPFGSAAVNGFDFDIESEIDPAPTYKGKTLSDYKTRGYGKMISTFRQTLFKKDSSHKYFIGAAPQCIVPDSHFGTLVTNYWFDFLFVQFYNTPQCSARAGIQHIQGSTSNDISYNKWANIKFANKDVKIFLGLPASTNASGSASFYLPPSQVQTLVNKFYSNARFGGIMLWEATYAMNNVICGNNYATWAKKILNAKKNGQKLSAPSTNSSCSSKRDIMAYGKRQAGAELPTDVVILSTALSTSSLPTSEVLVPAPAPTISTATEPVVLTTPSVVETADTLVPTIESPTVITTETVATSPVPSDPTSPVLITTQLASQTLTSAPVPTQNATIAAAALPDTSLSTISTSLTSVPISVPATVNTSANVTQAAALASNSASALSISTFSSLNNTSPAQKNAPASTTAAAVQTKSSSIASASINLTTASGTARSGTVNATATADAAEATITTAPEVQDNAVNGLTTTRYLTETITNVVYDTVSTCVASITDCADHPESQTVVYVTSTIDIVTTVYISGEPAPRATTITSDIYNTINVYYASASTDAGLSVAAKLFNPHADDDSTTTTTVDTTTTVYSTRTVTASRTTTTLTSTVTIWPMSSDQVEAAKKLAAQDNSSNDAKPAADAAVANKQERPASVSSATQAPSPSSSPEAQQSSPAPVKANVKVAADSSDNQKAAAAVQNVNQLPPKSYNSTAVPQTFKPANLKASLDPAPKNVNATGFFAPGANGHGSPIRKGAVVDSNGVEAKPLPGSGGDAVIPTPTPLPSAGSRTCVPVSVVLCLMALIWVL